MTNEINNDTFQSYEEFCIENARIQAGIDPSLESWLISEQEEIDGELDPEMTISGNIIKF